MTFADKHLFQRPAKPEPKHSNVVSMDEARKRLRKPMTQRAPEVLWPMSFPTLVMVGRWMAGTRRPSCPNVK